jgi:hypothetical protein
MKHAFLDNIGSILLLAGLDMAVTVAETNIRGESL